MRGFFVGVLLLTGLQAVVGTKESAGRVGGLFTAAAAVINHVVNPNVPAIPDLSGDLDTRAKVAPSSSTTTPSTGTADLPSGGLTTTRPTAPRTVNA